MLGMRETEEVDQSMRKATIGTTVAVLATLVFVAGIHQGRAVAVFGNTPTASRRSAEPTTPKKSTVQAAVQIATGEGASDLPHVASVGAILGQPAAPAGISAEQALEAAAKMMGPAPSNAKVSAEYKLLTLPGSPVISGKKLEAYPVYLITYDGVTIPTNGPFQKSPASPGKTTVAIDANTGEWIWGVAR
jgi:hypothetical protein